MLFDPQTKIGDIVLAFPAAMRVFERLNVDYCCGGQRSLADACARAGSSLPEVLARLEEAGGAEPRPTDPGTWQGATLTALIAHIEATHHAFTRAELTRVAPLMAKVLQVHGDHHPELARVAQCVQAMDSDLRPHLEKEEQILFPFIRGMEGQGRADCCFGTVQNPIRTMQSEHEEVGEILRELRELTAGFTPPEDACGSYRSLLMGLRSLEEDLHLHIYLESHLLFPRAIAMEGAALQD
ncbi:MAG: iron-sulfur cluster repair di-iron protein [Holophaga sp.]|nr:iron-sulfur cluster repair di-iron protein [Holophaga sp.]